MVGEDANDLKDERYPNGQEDQVCCAGHVMMAELVNLNKIRLNIEYYTSLLELLLEFLFTLRNTRTEMQYIKVVSNWKLVSVGQTW